MATVVNSEAYQRVSIGRVLSRATGAAGRNIPLVLVVWLIITGISWAWQWAVMGQVGAAAAADVSSTFIVTALLGWLVTAALSAISQTALTHAVLFDSQGQRVNPAQALMAGLPMILPVLAFTILYTLGIMVGFMLLLIPGLILLAMWAVGVPALIVERAGVIGSFGRSRELTKGHRWKVFGLLMLVGILYYLLIIVAGLIFGFSVLTPTPTSGTGALIALNLIGALLYLAWGLIGPALFVELRDAKDGVGGDTLEEVFA